MKNDPQHGKLSLTTKITYALGDHSINLVLSATSFFYLYFLTSVADLRPALAGLVVWLARVVDAVTDPMMGRLSDGTRWASGRRRPFFLIGAIPLALSFALMWTVSPFEDQTGKFFYYAFAYALMSVTSTVVSVPYLALIPEMATRYDERTAVNAFRAGAAVLGTLAAVGMKPLVDSLGGGPEAWATTGLIASVWVAVLWLPVHRVSFERSEYQRMVTVGILEGLRIALRQRSYRILMALYIFSRIAIDLIGALFLLYFTFYVGRADDFSKTLALFLLVGVASLAFWLRVSRTSDKRTIFLIGSIWWIVSQLIIYAAEPDWARWSMFLIAAVAAVGYAACDLMPWAMLGDVVDEDELATGERREGLFVGLFMFLRKLGGATAILVVGIALDLVGYVGSADPESQPQLAIDGIRALTSLGPAFFLTLAVLAALPYPLSRKAHADILERVERKRNAT
ncbi:glycoside-pentoside-hexuronide (GPH):cation symporter [Myxococcota bacterium]|nr:glycoside-pentoside-hexuronide (GPH):cation symporter [Myxococcota bacterium]